MKFSFPLLICLLTVGIVSAQTTPSAPLPPPAGEGVLTPKIACADLRGLTNYDFSIKSATLAASAADTPVRCRVKGLIQPEIQFEVNLPAAWNRRFFTLRKRSTNSGRGGERAAGADTDARDTYKLWARGRKTSSGCLWFRECSIARAVSVAAASTN